MDLSARSIGDLQKLKTRIEKEIEVRNKKQRGQALEEIKSIVAKYGLKLDEVMGQPVARSPRDGTVKTVSRTPKRPATILYRHPDNPAFTWTGGRGRPPQWVRDWKAAGRSLDEVRIANN